VIPPSLKQFARLEKNIVITGSIDHFEIWDRDLFYENTSPELHDSEALQAMLDRLNF
jgi:DNA-binding transcriptional regulator/RsmH inhibitor MraZ